jgi:SAM-dependent methyltransferase
MKVVYTVEVLHELRAARHGYNRRAAGTGERLVDLVDEKVGEMALAPASFPHDRQDQIVERARVSKYPYTLIFMIHQESRAPRRPSASRRESPADPRGALAEMARVTRPGGLVVVAEPTNVFGLVLQDLLRAAGLLDIEVRLNDRASPITPPYDSTPARAFVEETSDTIERDVWAWPCLQAERYFVAGGGAPAEFERLWAGLLEERRRVRRAIADRRYVGAGGSLFTVAWGRMPR